MIVFGVDFKYKNMKTKFLKIYLSAIKKAVNEDNINYGFHIKGPDWFIENDQTRNEIDEFFEIIMKIIQIS